MFDFDAVQSELQKCRDLARDYYGPLPHYAIWAPLDGPDWVPGETMIEAWAEANDLDAVTFSATSVDPIVALLSLQEQLRAAMAVRARARVIRRAKRLSPT